ncbi:MAG: glycosyltransferase, partial [Synergistaceae bacterium]|nr:glycosyltransferase [Synergistaceae bacterium]
MNKNKNFLIAAGGTGGHIFPAIVFGQELEKENN